MHSMIKYYFEIRGTVVTTLNYIVRSIIVFFNYA